MYTVDYAQKAVKYGKLIGTRILQRDNKISFMTANSVQQDL